MMYYKYLTLIFVMPYIQLLFEIELFITFIKVINVKIILILL